MYVRKKIYIHAHFLKPHLHISKSSQINNLIMHLQVLTLLFFCVAQIQLTKQQRRFSVVFRSFHEEQLSQVDDMKGFHCFLRDLEDNPWSLAAVTRNRYRTARRDVETGESWFFRFQKLRYKLSRCGDFWSCLFRQLTEIQDLGWLIDGNCNRL